MLSMFFSAEAYNQEISGFINPIVNQQGSDQGIYEMFGSATAFQANCDVVASVCSSIWVTGGVRRSNDDFGIAGSCPIGICDGNIAVAIALWVRARACCVG